MKLEPDVRDEELEPDKLKPDDELEWDDKLESDEELPDLDEESLTNTTKKHEQQREENWGRLTLQARSRSKEPNPFMPEIITKGISLASSIENSEKLGCIVMPTHHSIKQTSYSY